MSQLKSRFLSVAARLHRMPLAASMGVLCTLAVANPPCPADFDGDGAVTVADLSLALMDFGACGSGLPCPADLDGDAEVTAADISLLLMDFGDCPAWYTVLEQAPDPTVVWDATLRAAITATGKPWRVRDNGTNIEMVLIPPGTFFMGCASGCWADDETQHEVTLTQAFYCGRTEVTQAQWVAKMGRNPSYFTGDASRPVEQVSWDDIQPFCTATGMRLPTEAEWEYSYRAGTTTSYHGSLGYPNGSSDFEVKSTIAWWGLNSSYQTHSVAGKAANGFGLHDMSGNVWEWCQDWYADYGAEPQTNPTGPSSGGMRVLRGGCCFLGIERDGYTAYERFSWPPYGQGGNISGFRVARNP